MPRRPSLLAGYVWLIVRNTIGWILILASWALGIISPIPIGFLLFLIGFGLIWFPGKRRMTARVLRGSPVSASSRGFRMTLWACAVIVPTLLVIWLNKTFHFPYQVRSLAGLVFGSLYFAAALTTLFFGASIRLLVNRLLRLMPKARRRARPWLRARGIDLLPRRRRTRPLRPGGPITRDPDEEIIEIAPRYRTSAQNAWQMSQPWLRRVVALGVTFAIFAWMFKPVLSNWSHIRQHAQQIDWLRFICASLMFGIFLFVFRVLSWRRILLGLGSALPLAAATRIWSASELARYLPGVIWQVVGRVYLCRPYGISGTICSTSQVLELMIFLLANVLVAVSCLAWFGFKQMQHEARAWFLFVLPLIPTLLLMIHPRVFHRILDFALRKLDKPPVENRLRSRELLALLGWVILGLLWQSLAIWLVTSGPLGLKLAKWWVVAGAYCLAWCAGFLAFWAPGGLGVRELIFVAAMKVALPPTLRVQFENHNVLLGFLAFLSILLRLWATGGELLLNAVGQLADRPSIRPRQIKGTRPPMHVPREQAV